MWLECSWEESLICKQGSGGSDGQRSCIIRPLFLLSVSPRVLLKMPPIWSARPTPPGTVSRRHWRWGRPPPQKSAEPSPVWRHLWLHAFPHFSLPVHQCSILTRHRPYSWQPPKLHQQRVLCYHGAMGDDGAAAASNPPWDQWCRLQVVGRAQQATLMAHRSPVWTPAVEESYYRGEGWTTCSNVCLS